MFDAKEEKRWNVSLMILLAFAAIIYLSSTISPPSLMDDSDAVEAQIARTMFVTGDWVTARLDGVAYLEKSPLPWWLMDISYKVFGIHDWAARIPIALSAIALAWLTAAFGRWAFGARAGYCAGLVMGTCIGLWLFTRILIPDVMLTFTIALAMWAFLRVVDQNGDEEEQHPRAWAYVFYINLGLGLLLKSLIAIVFPIAAAALYLLFTRQFFSRKTWKRLHIVSGTLIMLVVAAPWHILATLRNPPYWAWTLKSAPGHYHGFLWFYFINEQLLRFLNLRYPRDYDTVPRLWFWLFHLVWLFPWSVYFPAVCKLSFKPVDRAGRTRLLALCWIGFVLVFFTLSTTQEYYSMPCYPALALLLGSAMAMENEDAKRWLRGGTRILSIITGIAALAAIAILFHDRYVPTPGDITAALSRHPNAYKLSLGHMEDLTLESFAYLRTPLTLAAVAFLVGCIGSIRTKSNKVYLAAAVMMVLFFQAARLAMVRFDPLLSSRDLANLILQDEKDRGTPGQIVIDHHYYWESSIAFYTGQPELLLNGRWNNLEYGSNAPGVPDVFIDDAKLKTLWAQPRRYYLVARADQLLRFDDLLGRGSFQVMKISGGKMLLTNGPMLQP